MMLAVAFSTLNQICRKESAQSESFQLKGNEICACRSYQIAAVTETSIQDARPTEISQRPKCS